MRELEKIREEWKNEGLSFSEIEKNLQTLKKIYIGQNVRSKGILSSDLTGAKLQVKKFTEKGFNNGKLLV